MSFDLERIGQRIVGIDTEIVEHRWSASAKLELRATLAQLEIAKALCRIADQMEKQHGNS
jgi:hypothetical protein